MSMILTLKLIFKVNWRTFLIVKAISW